MDYKDKIRKLLALAKSPEPEEAKLALLKARKLMAEHKLSERDLEERNTTVIKRAIGEKFSKKANSWMDPLSIVIGENYCCSAFRCKIILDSVPGITPYYWDIPEGFVVPSVFFPQPELTPLGDTFASY